MQPLKVKEKISIKIFTSFASNGPKYLALTLAGLLGNYFNIMTRLQILLFQITNKTNLTLLNQSTIP